jgi:hypothetical protein
VNEAYAYRAHEKGPGDVELWNLALAAIFFCAMGTFAGVAALYLTSTPFRPLAHQAAEIVLFCMFAIALFAVIATLLQTTREITKRPRASLRLDFGQGEVVTSLHPAPVVCRSALREASAAEATKSKRLESIATLPRGLTKISLTVPVRVPLLAAPEEFSHQLFALLGVAILPRDCASGRSRSVRGSHGAEPVST